MADFLPALIAEGETAAVKPDWGKISFIALGVVAVVLLIAVIVLVVLLLKKKRRVSESQPASERDLRPVISVDVGKVHEQGKREYQQDSFGVSDSVLMQTHGCLAIVADGMGGLSDGDKVSIRTVEEILDSFPMYQGRGNLEQILLMLTQKALVKVNDFLGEDNFRKSGSTLVMGLIKNGYFSFVSIGDSRICLYRDGTVIPLNREHIYRRDLIVRALNDEISFSDAYADKSGTGLTNYLGMGRLADIDLPAEPIRLYNGDKIILMSDGIYNAISIDEMARALSKPAAEAAEAIRAAVEAKGYSNQDNYTGIILECKTEAPLHSEPIPVEKPKASAKKPSASVDDIPKTADVT